jgi:hypothetical protein
VAHDTATLAVVGRLAPAVEGPGHRAFGPCARLADVDTRLVIIGGPLFGEEGSTELHQLVQGTRPRVAGCTSPEPSRTLPARWLVTWSHSRREVQPSATSFVGTMARTSRDCAERRRPSTSWRRRRSRHGWLYRWVTQGLARLAGGVDRTISCLSASGPVGPAEVFAARWPHQLGDLLRSWWNRSVTPRLSLPRRTAGNFFAGFLIRWSSSRPWGLRASHRRRFDAAVRRGRLSQRSP